MHDFVYRSPCLSLVSVFFLNDTATTEIYTLSLHDALPIFANAPETQQPPKPADGQQDAGQRDGGGEDRKSTRLNSSHGYISYAVFCLKKKNHTHHYSLAQTVARRHRNHSSHHT